MAALYIRTATNVKVLVKKNYLPKQLHIISLKWLTLIQMNHLNNIILSSPLEAIKIGIIMSRMGLYIETI